MQRWMNKAIRRLKVCQSHAVLFPKFEKTELGNEDGLRSGDLDIRLLHQSS